MDVKGTATEAAMNTAIGTKLAAPQPATPIDEEIGRLHDAAGVGASLLGQLEEAVYKVTNQQNLPPAGADDAADLYRTPLANAIYSATEKFEYNNDRLRNLIRALDL